MLKVNLSEVFVLSHALKLYNILARYMKTLGLRIDDMKNIECKHSLKVTERDKQ